MKNEKIIFKVRIKALFVDDDKVLGPYLVEVLKKYGIDVEWVSDGDRAQGIVLERRHHVYIMDLDLGKCIYQGADLIRIIRQQAIPALVVIFTNNGNSDLACRYHDDGVPTYIRKDADRIIEVNRLTDVDLLARRIWDNLPERVMTNAILRHGDFTFDSDTGIVCCNGKRVELGPALSALLKFMMLHTGEAQEYTEIAKNVLGRDDRFAGEGRSNSTNLRYVKKIVSRLKRKLRNNGIASPITRKETGSYVVPQI